MIDFLSVKILVIMVNGLNPGVAESLFCCACPRINYVVVPVHELRTNYELAQAMQRLYQQHNFNPNQRKWLERLAKQLVHEVVVDREFVNNCFANDGGAKRLNMVLEEQLDTVLEELREGIWLQLG